MLSTKPASIRKVGIKILQAEQGIGFQCSNPLFGKHFGKKKREEAATSGSWIRIQRCGNSLQVLPCCCPSNWQQLRRTVWKLEKQLYSQIKDSLIDQATCNPRDRNAPQFRCLGLSYRNDWNWVFHHLRLKLGLNPDKSIVKLQDILLKMAPTERCRQYDGDQWLVEQTWLEELADDEKSLNIIKQAFNR